MKNSYEKNEKMFLDANASEYSSVCWTVSANEHTDSETAYVNCDVRISDCFKVASLDFSYSFKKAGAKIDPEEDAQQDTTLDDRIQKLNSLIDSLVRFRAALEEANEVALLQTFSEEKVQKTKTEIDDLFK